MKAKDLKILRKKLTKANRTDNDPLSCFSKDTLSFSVLQKTNTEPESGLETDDAEKNLSVKFVPSSGLSDPQLQSCFSKCLELEHGAWNMEHIDSRRTDCPSRT